jgi:lipopolysaccharide export system protein LptA
MPEKSGLLKYLTLFILYACSSAFLHGQTSKKIRIVGANSLEYDDRVPDARRLIGNVIFEHEGALLYCDSAYFFEGADRMEAYSNVRIISDSVIVSGNRLSYDGKNKIADIIGNVRLKDPSSTLTTSQLKYNLQSKEAIYTTGGKIISNKEKNQLTSVFGQYKSAKRMFYFRKNVKLINPDYTMDCDSLQYNTTTETAYFTGPTWIRSDENTIYCENGFYNTKKDNSEFGKNAKINSKGQEIMGDEIRYDRKKRIGKARKNVSIKDSVNQVILTGNYADYFEKEQVVLMTDSAAMQKIFGKDTLYLHGDTLRSVADTIAKKRTFYAFHHVRFFKKDFQGKCDSLTYSEKDSLMRLFGNPVLWNEANQLLGDSVYIQLANNELNTLYLKNAAFIISEVDSLNYNQIKGRDITGQFVNSELKKVFVKGNGQSIYFASDEKGKYIGINRADCSDMLIYLDSNEVSKITFLKKPDAKLIPVNKISPKELQLRGFKWFGALRPRKKEDIFLRPSETLLN